MEDKDATQEALEQVEKATDSERAKGEDLLGSVDLKRKLREAKKRIIDRLQTDYAKLKQEWQGDTSYDAWFARQVNNAQLNSVAAYYDLVPGFEHLLELNGGDLEKFYTEAERLSKMPKKDRHQRLNALGKGEEKQHLKAF